MRSVFGPKSVRSSCRYWIETFFVATILPFQLKGATIFAASLPVATNAGRSNSCNRLATFLTRGGTLGAAPFHDVEFHLLQGWRPALPAPAAGRTGAADMAVPEANHDGGFRRYRHCPAVMIDPDALSGHAWRAGGGVAPAATAGPCCSCAAGANGPSFSRGDAAALSPNISAVRALPSPVQFRPA